MEYFDFRNKFYNFVTERLTNKYRLDNLHFEMGALLVEDLIAIMWKNMVSGKDLEKSVEKAFAELHDRIQNLRPLTHGYMIVYSTGDDIDTIPYAGHVSVFRGLVGTEFADECCATRFAEEDGVKLIHGLWGAPDGLYLDTETNRSIIKRYLQGQSGIKTVVHISDQKDQNGGNVQE